VNQLYRRLAGIYRSQKTESGVGVLVPARHWRESWETRLTREGYRVIDVTWHGEAYCLIKTFRRQDIKR